MNDDSLMPFGKYKGTKLANVPARYLIWLYYNDLKPGELKDYIADNLQALDMEVNKENQNKKY